MKFKEHYLVEENETITAVDFLEGILEFFLDEKNLPDSFYEPQPLLSKYENNRSKLLSDFVDFVEGYFSKVVGEYTDDTPVTKEQLGEVLDLVDENRDKFEFIDFGRHFKGDPRDPATDTRSADRAQDQSAQVVEDLVKAIRGHFGIPE